MWNRIYALLVARNIEFFRDRSALAWSVLLPVLIIFVFAFAFTDDNPEKFKVGLVSGNTLDGAAATFGDTRYIKFIDFDEVETSLQKVERHQVDLLFDPDSNRYWINQTSPNGYIVEKLLIAAYADSLSRTKIKDVFSTETLREVIHDSLTIMGRYPELVGRDNQFATQVVEAVFEAAALLVKDGFRHDDFIAVLDAAVGTANENVALLETKDSLTAILSAVGEGLTLDSVKGLLTSKGRKDALLAAVGAVAVNPTVWHNLKSKELVQPLVIGLLSGIEKDPTKLLSGPVLVDYLRRSLTAAARRGNSLVDDKLDPSVLKSVLSISLESAKMEIGKTIDGESLPVFMERVLQKVFKSHLEIDLKNEAIIKKLAEGIVAEFEEV